MHSRRWQLRQVCVVLSNSLNVSWQYSRANQINRTAQVENETQGGGDLLVPHPDEALVRAQNAQRIARRREAAALALQVQQTSGEDLSRFGERRKVGGRFEKLQKIPERKAASRGELDMKDILNFLSILSVDPSEQLLGSKKFISSFGPFILGLNKTGADS